MSSPEYPRTQRLLRVGFWITFAVCSYYAVVLPVTEDLGFDVSDVALHGLAFVVLTGLLLMAYLPDDWVRSVLLMAAYAITIELVQTQLPNREAELKDLVVDGAGIAIGVVLFRLAGAWALKTAGRIIG